MNIWIHTYVLGYKFHIILIDIDSRIFIPSLLIKFTPVDI